MKENELAFRGRTIDLAKALPLRVYDLLALRREGVDFDKAMAERDFDNWFRIAVYVLQKADATVTEAEVGLLLPDQFAEVAQAIDTVEARLRAAEAPFSSSPTSSAEPTAGAQTSS